MAVIDHISPKADAVPNAANETHPKIQKCKIYINYMGVIFYLHYHAIYNKWFVHYEKKSLYINGIHHKYTYGTY